MNSTYRTTELELASFLKARGHRLIDAKLSGRFVEFEFEDKSSHDINQYFCGALVSARELFEAHRALRGLCKQVKEHSEHNSQKITASENTRNERNARRS